MVDGDEKLRINPDYPLAQLMRSVGDRARQWQKVLGGLLDGTLRIGSRAPVGETPPWVTLEVVHGGFATGSFAAGGPLQPHEREKQASLGHTADNTERTALNLHFLGDAGRHELETMLSDGGFRLQVPEEGALLIAAWLLRHEETDRAANLIETILRFFDRLRFYPVPHVRPLRVGESVAIQPAAASVKSLRRKRSQKSVERMNESIRVWAPLYDQAVALFLETVDGDIPTLRSSESGELLRSPNGQPIVAGGWPCRRYPEGWQARAQALLDGYRRERDQRRLCNKPEKPKENFARLRSYLEKCVSDPRSLSGRDVGMIRKIVAGFVTRRGAPGSDAHQRMRTAQTQIAARPTHTSIARILADRLDRHPPDEGVPDIEADLQPLSADEALIIGASAHEPIPASLRAKVLRCLEAPVATLVERGLVPSSEALARLVPVITANVRAAAITDPELRRVYAAVYMAFRQRRSLLLLDLESQVRLRELPWIEAVEPWVGSDDESRTAARRALIETTALALRSFPHTILPNTLIKELRTLASGAGVDLPLVNELAADIFMGSFSETFLRAAKTAAQRLTGSLYARYYGVPYDRVLLFDDVEKNRFGRTTSPEFAALCIELAQTDAAGTRSVARNGTIIEQAQIVTTQNLAVVFAKLDLASLLDKSDLACRTFEWVCHRQQLKFTDWQAQLQTMKNTAYAWRQMIFYLSLMDHAEVSSFLDWSADHLSKQQPEFRMRFEAVLSGLRAIARGDRFDPVGGHASGGRRFLGWSVGRHWLFPQPVEQSPQQADDNSRS
ncbi:MAG: hypothetical protein H6729_09840 [Deltaproteobacteria bacterium]|nr:hypothetical protein [Deltaproteobacteria bacterium]